jgi:predicted Zn-dependent protease
LSELETDPAALYWRPVYEGLPMNRTLSKSLLGAILLVLLLSSCASSPTGRKQLILTSSADLEREGTRQFRIIQEQAPLVKNGATIDFVACVADAIVGALGDEGGNLYWELAIVDQPTVNAYVLPGGKIVVQAGILGVTQNQHQLAAVLGHEVAHVTANHSIERASRAALTGVGVDIAAILLGGGYSTQTQGAYDALRTGVDLGIMNPFSRKMETEADIVGLMYMARAGFDPRQSVELWKNMNAKNLSKIPEFMSTHPSGDTRIENLVAAFPEALSLYNEAQAQGKDPHCGG